jgi:hypothetical protein
MFVRVPNNMGNTFSLFSHRQDHNNNAIQPAPPIYRGQGEGGMNFYKQEVNGVLLSNYLNGRGWISEVPPIGLPCPQCRQEFHFEQHPDRNLLTCDCGLEIETRDSIQDLKNILFGYLDIHKWCLESILYYAHQNQLFIECYRCTENTMVTH